MIESSSASVQWLRRYKLFIFAALILFVIQLFLGYLLPIFGNTDDIYNSNSASLYSNLIEIRNGYKNQAAFDELFHDEETLAFDDEDISNSNPIVNFKELTIGDGGGGGLALPKILVASSAKGDINGHHQINTNNIPNDIQRNVAKDKADSNKNNQPKITSTSSLSSDTNLKLDNNKFKPACDIVAKEAISAIYRAQSRQCKELIANTTCAIQSGKTFFIIFHNCLFSSNSFFILLFRYVLSDHFAKLLPTRTVQ